MMGDSQAKIWTPAFTAITAVNFFHSLGFYLLLVMLTEYSVVTWNLPYSVAGLGMTSYIVSSVLARMLLGGKIDAWGPKIALLVGFGFDIVASLIYLPQLSFGLLLFGRLLHGIGNGLCSGAAAAAASLVLPAERKAEGIGYYSMATALAAGVGPFAAIGLINLFDSYFVMLVFLLVINVISFALCLPLAIKKVCPVSEQSKSKTLALDGLFHPKALPLSLIIMLVFFCYSGAVTFLTLFADSRGLQEAASVYFVVYAAVALITRPKFGKRVDRKGENSVLYFTIPAVAVGFAVLALSHNDASLLLSALFMGIGVGGTQSVAMATVVKLTPSDQAGRAQSTFINGMDIGLGIGPVALGAIVTLWGYETTFFMIAAFALFTFALYYLVHGRFAKAATERRRND